MEKYNDDNNRTDLQAKGFVRTITGEFMGYVSSNMLNLEGPIIEIFVGFLLAITGCVLMLTAPDLSQASYALFLIAGILLALAITAIMND